MKYASLHGYIALMTVLILLVFSTSLLLAIPYLAIGGAQEGLVLYQGEAALAVLEGCAEDALLLSVRDENYTGGTRDYFGARCAVSIEKNDTNWVFSIVAIKDGVTRTLEISADRTAGNPGTLTLLHWLEQ